MRRSVWKNKTRTDPRRSVSNSLGFYLGFIVIAEQIVVVVSEDGGYRIDFVHPSIIRVCLIHFVISIHLRIVHKVVELNLLLIYDC